MREGPISPAALLDRIVGGQAPVVLEVRSPREFGEGHVPDYYFVIAARIAKASLSGIRKPRL